MVQEDRPEGVQSPMKAKACATALMETNRIALKSHYWAAFIRSEVASVIKHDSSLSGTMLAHLHTTELERHTGTTVFCTQ